MVRDLGLPSESPADFVGDQVGDGVDGLGKEVAAAGEALRNAPPLQFRDGALDRNPLRGPAFAVVFPLDIAEANRNDERVYVSIW
jgi:hypothetical protein